MHNETWAKIRKDNVIILKIYHFYAHLRYKFQVWHYEITNEWETILM
jgi:hypothetical protein